MMGLLPDLRESRNGAHTARRDRVDTIVEQYDC